MGQPLYYSQNARRNSGLTAPQIQNNYVIEIIIQIFIKKLLNKFSTFYQKVILEYDYCCIKIGTDILRRLQIPTP